MRLPITLMDDTLVLFKLLEIYYNIEITKKTFQLYDLLYIFLEKFRFILRKIPKEILNSFRWP